MPDGGVGMFYIANKFKTSLKWKFISDTFRDNLLDLYLDAKPLYYIPYPTTTAWDGNAYEAQWTNDFNFSYSENSKTQGQGGSMILEETAGR
jgi:hypothetical protein